VAAFRGGGDGLKRVAHPPRATIGRGPSLPSGSTTITVPSAISRPRPLARHAARASLAAQPPGRSRGRAGSGSMTPLPSTKEPTPRTANRGKALKPKRSLGPSLFVAGCYRDCYRTGEVHPRCAGRCGPCEAPPNTTSGCAAHAPSAPGRALANVEVAADPDSRSGSRTTAPSLRRCRRAGGVSREGLLWPASRPASESGGLAGAVELARDIAAFDYPHCPYEVYA